MTEEREKLGTCDRALKEDWLFPRHQKPHVELNNCLNWREQPAQAVPPEFLAWWNQNWHGLCPTHQALWAWKMGAERAESALAECRNKTLDEWIPVSERLPELADEYLVSEPHTNPVTADFRDGRWFTVRSYGYDSENRELHNVTHWRPLPNPPVEGERQEPVDREEK